MRKVCEMETMVVVMWVHSVGTKDNKKRNGGNNRSMSRNWKQKDNKLTGWKATTEGGGRKRESREERYL